MANDPGFLSRLGLSSIDERALMQAQRNAVFRGQAAQQRALGQQASPLIHGMLGAAGGLITGNNEGRSVSGVRDNFIRGAQEQDERQVAEAAGMSVEQLRAKRAIRQALSEANIPDDGSFESRIRMAQIAARTAMEVGDPEVLGQSLSELTAIRTEMKEFDKLSAQTRKAEKDLEDDVKDIWLRGENTPRTAIISQDGATFTSDDGQPVLVPHGQYSLEDPLKAEKKRADNKAKPFIETYRKNVPSADRSAIANSVEAAATGMVKVERLLDSVIDWSEQGGVESILATSGKMLAFGDNLVRNAQGFISPFVRDQDGNKTSKVRRDDGKWVSLNQEIKDIRNSKYNIRLPENVRAASAAAQNFQAQVIDLAYAVARMREPSNRGLSDKDVQAAIDQLTAGSSNPQVIMRRFVEMTLDNATSITNRIGSWYGLFEDEMSEEEFTRKVGGTTLVRYMEGLDRLKKRFKVEGTDTNRAVFDEPIDTDVQPGEGIYDTPSDEDVALFDNILGT